MAAHEQAGNGPHADKVLRCRCQFRAKGKNEMTVPTRGEVFDNLIYHIRMAQENAAMMGHLINAESPKVGSKDSAMAKGWLTISEAFRLMEHKIIALAKGKLQ